MLREHLCARGLPGYAARPLCEADLPAMLALCRGNPFYFEHLGRGPTEDGLRQDLTALPPGKTAADKAFVGLYDGQGALAALLDLIDGYPAPGTAYIGWFILASARQGRGEGAKLAGSLLDFLRGEGFGAVELAYVKTNPQAAHFWRKVGFAPTGAETDTGACVLVKMRRAL